MTAHCVTTTRACTPSTTAVQPPASSTSVPPADSKRAGLRGARPARPVPRCVRRSARARVPTRRRVRARAVRPPGRPRPPRRPRCRRVARKHGFDSVRAPVVSLVADTAPVAFGAMGTPVMTLAQATGLPLDTVTRRSRTRPRVPGCAGRQTSARRSGTRHSPRSTG
ncbi:L-lactate permease [Streptomyces sp. NPDC001537]